MLRIILGVFVGFFAWLIVWVVSEKIISAIWPAFGTHQRAFEDAIKNGGQFTAETPMLFTHIVMGSIVSVMAGALATLIAGENASAALRRYSVVSHGHYESRDVVGVRSNLVSRSLYCDTASNGDRGR